MSETPEHADSIARMEPDIARVWDEITGTSIAISLKRIADAIERAYPAPVKTKYEMLYECPVEIAGLPTMAANAFRNSGHGTLGHIYHIGSRASARLPNIGKLAIMSLIIKFNSMGYDGKDWGSR